MTHDPPRHLPELVRRGIRLLAAAVITLVVVLVTTAADGGGAIAVVSGGVLLVVGAVFQLKDERHSALATSSIVAGAALVVVGVRAQITPTGDDLDLFLTVAGSLSVILGLAFDERRLVSLGLLQWVLVLMRPEADAVPFRHCLIATDLAIPVPQLDGVLLLALGATAVGSAMRFAGWRLEAARGAEVTGVVSLQAALLAKAVELPDLAVLCGAGRGIDPGWLWLAMGVAVLVGAYGAVGRDPVWAVVGAGGLAVGGLAGTGLSGEARWATLAVVPLITTLVLAERAGVSWPRRPGYGHRRPWERP